jgi:hypothetical protein
MESINDLNSIHPMKMIEHPTKSNFKNPKKLEFQSTFNAENPMFGFIWFLLDWT